MPRPIGSADRENGEQRVVERERRKRDERDGQAGEPAAQAEHDRVHGAEQEARLAPDPAAPARAAHSSSSERATRARQAEHGAREALAERRLRQLRREVDLHRRVQRGVDLAVVEERVQEPRARLRLLAPERDRVAEARQHDLVAVREVREELPRRDLRRRREVELAADEQRRHLRVCTRVYSSVGRASQATRPPVRRRPKDEVAPRVADERAAAARRRARSSARPPACPPSRPRPARPRRTTPGRRAGRAATRSRAHSRRRRRPRARRRWSSGRTAAPRPASTPSARRRRRSARCPSRDRQAPEAGRRIRRRPLQGRREVVGALAARSGPRRRARVAADLLVRHFRVPEEVPGRVHADHHRAVDALRVAPGVDHRRARAGALAEQVDLPVAERLPRRLEVVDLLRAAP